MVPTTNAMSNFECSTPKRGAMNDESAATVPPASLVGDSSEPGDTMNGQKVRQWRKQNKHLSGHHADSFGGGITSVTWHQKVETISALQARPCNVDYKTNCAYLLEIWPVKMRVKYEYFYVNTLQCTEMIASY